MTRLLVLLVLTFGSCALSRAQSYAELRAHLVSEEGYRHKQYMVRGIPHIGIGHRVYQSTGPLTRYQIEALFERDLKIACDAAYHGVKRFGFHPKQVRILLVAMAFSVGSTGFTEFARFRAAIDRYDYRDAANELRQSAWSRQLPARSDRYQAILLSIP